jgi:predicted amidohydrolase
MKIGFFQFSPRRGDVNANLSTISAALEDCEFDLIVLPELASTGYLFDDPAELYELSEPGDGSGVTLSGLIELAARHRACIVSGFSERAPEGLYNSAAAVDGRGVLCVYRKVHLFNTEKALFFPGNCGFPVVNYRNVHLGMMICFDWVFPEAARSLALKGAQLICHPANLVLPWCQSAMRTRSLENAVFSITANRTGAESGQGQSLRFTGRSQILSPKGELLGQAGEDDQAVRIVDVDLQQASNKNFGTGNNLFADRRPAQYEL